MALDLIRDKLTMPFGMQVVILAAVVGGTAYMVNLQRDTNERISALETSNRRGWSQADQVSWTQQLKIQNPALNVPLPVPIVNAEVTSR